MYKDREGIRGNRVLSVCVIVVVVIKLENAYDCIYKQQQPQQKKEQSVVGEQSKMVSTERGDC